MKLTMKQAAMVGGLFAVLVGLGLAWVFAGGGAGATWGEQDATATAVPYPAPGTRQAAAYPEPGRVWSEQWEGGTIDTRCEFTIAPMTQPMTVSLGRGYRVLAYSEGVMVSSDTISKTLLADEIVTIGDRGVYTITNNSEGPHILICPPRDDT